MYHGFEKNYVLSLGLKWKRDILNNILFVHSIMHSHTETALAMGDMNPQVYQGGIPLGYNQLCSSVGDRVLYYTSREVRVFIYISLVITARSLHYYAHEIVGVASFLFEI